jgi:hypothetical protein
MTLAKPLNRYGHESNQSITLTVNAVTIPPPFSCHWKCHELMTFARLFLRFLVLLDADRNRALVATE